MKIELQYGEHVTVAFDGTDGEINVHYAKGKISAFATLEDSAGRMGTIYEEIFNEEDEDALPSGEPQVEEPYDPSQEMAKSALARVKLVQNVREIIHSFIGMYPTGSSMTLRKAINELSATDQEKRQIRIALDALINL